MSTNFINLIAKPITHLTIFGISSASLLYCTSSSSSSTSTISTSRPTFNACPEIACKSKEELAALFGERSSGLTRRLPSSNDKSNTNTTTSKSSSSSSSNTMNSSTSTTYKNSSDDSSSTIITNSSASSVKPSSVYDKGCPPDREELGNHSWTLVSIFY